MSFVAVEEDGTGGLVMEGFDDAIKVGADVVLLHGCPKAVCQTLSKACLKSIKNMVEVLLVWLQSVQYDLQHDFPWVTDEADHSVVLALLQVAFFGKCDE